MVLVFPRPGSPLLAGVEMRLRLASIDSGKFGASWFNSLNRLARLGWKF